MCRWSLRALWAKQTLTARCARPDFFPEWLAVPDESAKHHRSESKPHGAYMGHTERAIPMVGRRWVCPSCLKKGSSLTREDGTLGFEQISPALGGAGPYDLNGRRPGATRAGQFQIRYSLQSPGSANTDPHLPLKLPSGAKQQ